MSDGTALRFPDFRKFTGDGLIIIWKEKPEDGTEFGERIVRALRLLQERFSEFIRDLHTENNAQLPNRIRVGISRGGLFPVKTTRGSGDPDDFVGYVINLACRIQTLRCGFVVTEHVLAPLAPERLGMSRILLPDLKGCRARTAYVFPEDV